jgi:cytochrome c oxidase subunit 2
VLGLFYFSYSSKKMMNSTTKTFASGLLWAGAWVATAAHAVNDLPGGPAVRQLNMHPPATNIAAEQHSLHWMMMVICMLIFVAVFGVMFYSIWKHRKSVGHKPASFHESVKVEIAWTVVPLIIVVIMAIPATRTVVAQKDTSNADITIKATGYQWRWGYDYLKGEGDGISFISSLDNEQRVLSNTGAKGVNLDNYLLKVDNPLVVPVNKKIRIITTSSDVIHAFAVPSFGIKQDAIPGFVRDTWFKAEITGDFYGQCQELCGKEHAYMPIHVKVLSEADYSAWVKTQQTKKSAEAQPAQQVAQANTAK